MQKIFGVTLDIKEPTRLPKFEVVQGDFNTNVLNIILVEDGYKPVNISGYTIEMAFAKPDGTTVLQDQSNGVTIVNAANGNIRCLLRTNTIAAPGVVKAEVRILQGTNVLTSTQFCFVVRKAILNDDTVESVDEIPALDRLVDEYEQLLEDFPKFRILGEFDTVQELKQTYPNGSQLDGGFMIQGSYWAWNSITNQWEDYGSFRGEKGDKGDTGTSVVLLGKFDTLEDLETTYPDGSMLEGGFLVGDDYYFWSTLTNQWENAGPLVGPSVLDHDRLENLE